MSLVINDTNILTGFSKLSKEEKTEIITALVEEPDQKRKLLNSFLHKDEGFQKKLDEFSENTVSNFHFPFGIAPNFLINGKLFHVPMVIEESSVVAAASKAAKFWSEHNGFHAEVVDVAKIGQVHFIWKGSKEFLYSVFPELKESLRHSVKQITANMVKRGGGLIDIELVDMTAEMDGYYQLKATFDTVDSMGANFINSCLEEFARVLKDFFNNEAITGASHGDFQVIMAILSNYSPDCRVRAWVEAPVDAFEGMDEELSAEEFLEKFIRATRIAEVDVHRAATHNKGIFNGIDALAMATGNDFRALEAAGHAYASRNGKYRSLTRASIENGMFRYELEIPMTLGTVGGLTKLHPLAEFSLDLLGQPDARQLMMISAATGLANNFSAIRSLVTKGIQVGHMKMHLLNILNHFQASEEEKEDAIEYFKTHKVSFNAVSTFLAEYRAGKH